MLLTPGLIDAHVHLGISSPIRRQFGFELSAAELAAGIFATAGDALDAGFTTCETSVASTAESSTLLRAARCVVRVSSRAVLCSARPVDTATTGPHGSRPSCGTCTTFQGSAPCP
ncbi:amidohydrolase family protein [Rhodococcus sp. BH4]|uniref:amidohydrolase family protein n=1 Tax=Rhodococcus sp. BH4 TaxID=1807790 RepID=UPI003FA7891B